ncbi:MAG: hypothetical protein K2W82_12815 [Candidatus Obscuribacterales bacterium]|nr:hypothetical protein [Candidatus Obscuribacterales bacterium]
MIKSAKNVALLLSLQLLTLPGASFAEEAGEKVATIYKGGVSHNVSPIKEDGSTETITAGTPVNLTISANLNSELSQVGDEIKAMVSADLKDKSGKKVLLPGQWTVHGKITRVDGQKRLGRNGAIDIKFDKLVSPDGKYEIPFEATATTKESAVKTGLKHVATDATYVSIGAVGGAIASVQFTGLPVAIATEGYSVAIGGGIGAALGLAAAAHRKGKVICSFPGDELQIRMTKPLILPAFNPEALPSAAPLAHLDNFDIKINRWRFLADPYGDKLSRLLIVNFKLENLTKEKYNLSDIAVLSERNKLYRPYATKADLLEMRKSVAPNAIQEAALTFGVDNPRYKYRLVLLDKDGKNILSELPIN